MTQYTKQSLEEQFKRIAFSRINEKKRDSTKYVGDAGYWDGGRCEYGGAHNLQEDCEKFVGFFTEINELRNARKELMNFTNQQEFEKQKQGLITKINNSLNGLQIKTGSNSSVGGTCIIWADFVSFWKSKLENFRKDLELLKKDVERASYNDFKELQKLKIEERNLKREIEENERKARNEPDENKKKTFLFLVDQAKDQLKELLEKKKNLKSSRLGDDFNPDKHIESFFQKLEEKLTPRDRTNRNPRNPQATTTNPNNSTGNNDNSIDDEEDIDNYSPTFNNKPFLKRYWREFLLIGVFSIGAYYIYNQPE